MDRRRRSIRLCAVLRAILRPAALVVDGSFFLDPLAAPADVDEAAETDVAADPSADVFDAAAAPAAATPLFPALIADAVCAELAAAVALAARGFIWMIFRDRVGGGGNVKASFVAVVVEVVGPTAAGGVACAACADDRRRDLTVSAACLGYLGFAVVADDKDEDDRRCCGGEFDGAAVGVFMSGPRGGESMLTSVSMAVTTDGLALRACCALPLSLPLPSAGGGSSNDICRPTSCLEPSWPGISVEELGVGGNVARGIAILVGGAVG